MLCIFTVGDKMITKFWKNNNILFLLVGALIVLSMSATAETIMDDAGDVWYKTASDGWFWSSQNVTDHPNIDIISVEYTLNGSILTLTMILNGEIDESKTVGYEICYGNLTDYTYYLARYLPYAGGGRYYFVGEGDIDDMGNLTHPISEDGKIFSTTFEIDDMDSTFEIWGQTYEYDDNDTGKWADFVPLKFEPEYSGEGPDDDDDTGNEDNNETSDGNNDENTGDTEKKGTPGFEILIVICAIALISLRKQKKKE